MFLAYDGIVFDVLLLNGWEIEAVMSEDGADFLYWHHLIDVTCIINPAVVATDIFPPLEFNKINAILKRRKQADDAMINILRSVGSVESIGERPTKSSLISNKSVPPTALPQASGKDTFFLDSVGNVSQKAGSGVPSYPPTTSVSPNSRYPSDLAAKTGPVSEPVSGWIDPRTGVPVAPANLKETD